MTDRYQCILIPGGGLLEDGSLPEWTISRLEKALALHDHTDWLITLSGGTVHKPPPLDKNGYPVFESRKAAAFLASEGVNPDRILSEISSYDTIGNAYFSRMLFAEPLSLARCLIVTSKFHMPRTEAIFRWVYSLAPTRLGYTLSFLSTPDEGLTSQALEARQSREKSSLKKLRLHIKSIGTLDLFQRWLYTEHGAYALQLPKERLTESELESY